MSKLLATLIAAALVSGTAFAAAAAPAEAKAQ
jgi:hypothetical protein